MSAQFNETIDYSKKTSLHSSYRWMKLTPVGGSGQTANLSTTSATIVNFEIPNNCMNLSQSKLAFDMTFANTSGTHCVDALGLSLFDRISLSTRSGVVLASADNMGQFCHIVSKIKTKASELIDNPSPCTALPTTFQTVTVVGVPAPHPLSSFPIQSPINTTQLISSKKPYTDICKCASCPITSVARTLITNATGVAANMLNVNVVSVIPSSMYRMDGSLISTPFLENLHIITENKIIAANSGLAISYQLPLFSVKDTLLEVNKSLYFGDNLILSLSFNPATKFSWQTGGGIDGGGSITATAVGTAPIFSAGVYPIQWSPICNTTIGVAVPLASTVVPQTVVPQLTNISLYVAIETDPIITSQLINEVNNEGFTMTIPYVYCTKSPVPVPASIFGSAVSSSAFSMQQRITRGYGHRLLRCYSAIFGAEGVTTQISVDAAHMLPLTIGDGSTIVGFTNVSNDGTLAQTGFTTNQHNDSCLGAYNTSLDGIRLQDFTVSASDSTHYLINEPYLRGSCILNVEQYKNQCMHIDSWTGKPVCQEDDTIVNGLSLDADKTYGVTYPTLYNITGSTMLNHYLWFVVQRTLAIKGNHILLN